MHTCTIAVGENEVVAHLYGPSDAKARGVDNWSLRALKDMRTGHSFLSAIYDTLLTAGIERCYAPNVTAANAEIVAKERLTTRFDFGRSTLYRNAFESGDGVFLEPGEGFMISTVEAPLIFTSGKEYFCVAVAGRDSLIDRNVVLGNPGRPHLSIVDALIAGFTERRVRPEQIEMTMHFSIPTLSFDHPLNHPRYGAFNQKLRELVNARWPGSIMQLGASIFPSLEAVFVSQAQAHGVARLWTGHPISELPDLARRNWRWENDRNLIVVKRTK